MKTLLLHVIHLVGQCRARWSGVELGKGVLIHGRPVFRCKQGGRIILEDGVILNAATWWNPLIGSITSLYAAPGATLRMERGAGLSGSQVVALQEIVIGEDSMIGAGTLICDSDMHGIPLGSGHPIETAPIRIGRRVFVGARCVILKGVTIGDGAVIGAGSVVTRDIPADTLVAGASASIIRTLRP